MCSVADSEKQRMIHAYELVDWLRLVDVHVSPTDLRRIAAVVCRLAPGAFSALYYQVAPGSGLLWSMLDTNGDGVLHILHPFH